MNAPTGRNASVTVMESAMAASVVWKSFAMAVRAKATRKKSKASSVHPRKAARTAAPADAVEGGETGVGAGAADIIA